MKKLLWRPTEDQIQNTQAWSFIQQVNQEFKTNLANFHELYQWSIDFPESFWSLFWEFSSLNANRKSSDVLKNKNDFLKSEWFAD